MSVRKFAPVDPNLPARIVVQNVDWEQCVLCQKKTHEQLVDPEKSTRKDKFEGLKSLASNLTTLSDSGGLSSLPFNISLSALDDGSGVLESLKTNKAKYHSSCKLKCSASKVSQLSKRARSDTETNTGMPSPTKTRRCSEPFTSETCVFCDGPATWKHDLHRISTDGMSENLLKHATLMRDRKLLCKLAGAHDAMALDAMYHNKCYTKFKNKIRSFEASQNSESSHQQELHEYALAELVAHINNIKDARGETNTMPVFRMADLSDVYSNILSSMGVDRSTHSSRLRERLLDACPYLYADGKPGQDYLISFRSDIDENVRTSVRDFHLQAFQFVDVARNIREDIFDHEPNNNEQNWQEMMEKQNETTPFSLKMLLKMILRGPGTVFPQEDEDDNFEQTVNTLSQLISYHTTKRAKAESTIRRHRKSQEKPVPVYLAMKIYGETRSKSILQTTHKLGLTISYDRLQRIMDERVTYLCSRFHQQGVVCPPSLRKGAFVIAAADNIDHNTTSYTAKSSFHGTAISIMQFTDSSQAGSLPKEFAECARPSTMEKKGYLPLHYAVVKPCQIDSKKCKITPSDNCMVPLDNVEYPHPREMEWLKSSTSGERLPWPVYHARSEVMTNRSLTHTAMMPLFAEQAHSIAMMAHVMEVVSAAVRHLNPDQAPVLVVDQPLFALCKILQQVRSESVGEDRFIVVMGDLHLEMASLRALGSWLDQSGWVEALIQAGVTTSGRAESMLKASHVTRTRYAHQVTAAVLYDLQRSAYEEYVATTEDPEIKEFEDWRTEKSLSVPQFKYWDLVLKLELTVLQLVRAVRSGDFELYKKSLTRLVIWFFALDQVNYARWLPIYIRDLAQLDVRHPDIAARFNAGDFVARKTKNPFSAIALDQNHEQMNAQLKGNGGMIGLTEAPDALRKWVLATPELAAYVATFEKAAFGVQDADDNPQHHSDNASFIQLFRRDCVALESVFVDMGNPFLEDSEELYNIASRTIAGEGAAEVVQTVEEVGRAQYEEYVKDRLETNNKSISDTIPQNRLSVWKSKRKSPVNSKQAAKISGLKNDCALFGRLFIACQSRDGDLAEFFSFENQPCPPALSVAGEIRSCAKSDIIGCLTNFEEDSVLSTGTPRVQAKLYDGAALVHMLQPGPATTFQEYASMVFLPYLKRECSAEGVCRIDVVWDVYKPSSLKNATREKRGHGNRMALTPTAKLPKKAWGSFLRESSNKTQLFEFLAESMESLSLDGVEFYSTQNSSVVSSSNADSSRLGNCNHEEADTRLFVHLTDAVCQGSRTCMIRTTDSDVLVLAVATFAKIPGLDELWVSIGTGGNQRYVAAHLISDSLGPDRAEALPFFHAFTGCDVVSSFSTKGKKSAFDTWIACPEVTSGFIAAASGDVEEAMPSIERYVVTLYDRTCDSVEVNECRRKLFTRKGRQPEAIPPTRDALLQHCRRAAYQGGFIWSHCTDSVLSLPDPSEWGWKRSGKEPLLLWEPVWTTQPSVQETLLLLVKCGCKLSCSARCKCKKADLPCTELCECGSTCYSVDDV